MLRQEMIIFMEIHGKSFKVKEILCRKFIKTTVIIIQSRNWGVNKQLSLEVIAVEYFPNSFYLGSNEKSVFHSYISDYNEQDACDSHSHKVNSFKTIESGILVSGMSTVWERN